MLAGATSAYHSMRLKSLMPDASAIVGSSGIRLKRAGVDTASARTLPDSQCCLPEPYVMNITGTRPVRTSVYAGATPLYGTWMMSMLAPRRRLSVAKCWPVALPLVANASWPGFAFA